MLKTYILSLLFIVTLHFTVKAQNKLTWNDLADVTFKPIYNSVYDMDFLMPTFGSTIKSYDGKTISIKGFFLDISGDGKVLLLSKYPMSMCFFCGGAGPETVIEVHFKKTPSFKTDQIVELTGVLELNKHNVDRCNYILKETTGLLVD